MFFFYNILQKIKQGENSRKIKIFVFFAGFLFIFYNFAFFVGKNAVNVPFWDQWELIDILTKKTSLWELFRFQHNEHRIGIGLIIIMFLAKLSHWSQILEIKFISLLIMFSSLIILYLRYFINKKIGILDLLIPLVFLNIFQFENISWGFQIPFILPVFFMCLWLLTINIWSINNRKRNLILTFISFLGAYSSFHGLILPAFAIGYIIFDFFKHKKEKIESIFPFIFLNLLTICSFFINYRKDFQAGIISSISWENIKYFSLAISNGFFFSLNNYPLDYFLAFLVFIFLLYGLLKIGLREKILPNTLIGVILILFSLSFILIITIGRSTIGIEQALSSRYVTLTMLIPTGLFFIFSDMKNELFLKTVLILFVTYNIIFLSPSIRNYSRVVTSGKQRALECYTNSAPDNYNDCFEIFNLYPDKNQLHFLIPKYIEIRKK